jgi:branched-chain amino acid transport system substrate-binding protein
VGAVALAACGSSSGTSTGGGGSSATELTLAAVYEGTGVAATNGTGYYEGMQLAVDAANGSNGFQVGGKTYKWKLDAYDDKSTADQAISYYRQFTGANDKFILGPGLSVAVTPAFDSLGDATPLIMTPAVAAATPFIGKKVGTNLYLTHLADAGDGNRIDKVTQYLTKTYSPKKVAILLPQDAAGESYTKLYTQYLTRGGATVVYSKSFANGTTDFSSYITAIKAAAPDMIVSGYLDTAMKPFMQQAVSAGLTNPVYVAAPGASAAAITAGSAPANYVFSIPTRAVDDPNDPKTATFRAAFQAKFGKAPAAPDFWALSYYDPILILTQAIEQAGTVDDLAKIKAAMTSDTTWKNTVLGEKFDPKSQEAVYVPQIGIITNGTTKYVDAS